MNKKRIPKETKAIFVYSAKVGWSLGLAFVPLGIRLPALAF